MISVVAVVIAVTISLLITRVGSMALMLTGLSREVARFQARSAFTGVGFTTSEAELILNHPVRRRIIMWLMLLGNAGVITVVATLVITFAQSGGAEDWLLRGLVFGAGFMALWFISWNRYVDRALTRAIAWGLRKWTAVDAKDYAHVLHLSNNYAVTELAVSKNDWLAEKTLAETRLRAEGVLVLGIERRNGQYIGTPNAETKILPDDTVILYGRKEVLTDLARRPRTSAGNDAHQQAAREQREVVEAERSRDIA